jgi:hypothetical protein
MKKTIRVILASFALCITAFTGKALDMSQTIGLERYTLIDANTYEYDYGELLLTGKFLVMTSNVFNYYLGLTPDDIAPISGKPVMGVDYFSGYQSTGVIPKWVRSRATFSLGGPESYVIVAVVGKGDPNPPITITKQPQNEQVLQGSFAFLYVNAEPYLYLSYQWYFKGKPISGATSSMLFVNNINNSQAGAYYVTLSTGSKPIQSLQAQVTVVTPVIIKTQPKALIVMANKSASFHVNVSGTPPYFYQWYWNGNPILNATKSSYTIPHVTAGNAGFYLVKINNGLSYANSDSVALTVP